MSLKCTLVPKCDVKQHSTTTTTTTIQLNTWDAVHLMCVQASE